MGPNEHTDDQSEGSPPSKDWPPGRPSIYGVLEGERPLKGRLAERPAMQAADPGGDLAVRKLEEARRLLLRSEGDVGARRRARDLVIDAVDAEERDPYLISHAAFLTFDLGDLKASARYLSRLQRSAAMALQPADVALVCYVLGHILLRHGDREEARDQFRTAIRTNPDEPAFVAALAASRRARATPEPTVPVRWTPSSSD